MAEKLTRVQRDIRDNPDKYDYADIPPARVKIPEQEAAYEVRAKAHRKMVVEYMGANFKAGR